MDGMAYLEQTFVGEAVAFGKRKKLVKLVCSVRVSGVFTERGNGQVCALVKSFTTHALDLGLRLLHGHFGAGSRGSDPRVVRNMKECVMVSAVVAMAARYPPPCVGSDPLPVKTGRGRVGLKSTSLRAGSGEPRHERNLEALFALDVWCLEWL